MYTGSRLQPQQQQQQQHQQQGSQSNFNLTTMNQNQNINYLQSQSISMPNTYANNRQTYYPNNGLLGAAPDSSTQLGILQTPQNSTHHLNYHHHNQNSLITLTNGPQQNVLRPNNANRVNNYAYNASSTQQQQNQAGNLNNTGVSLLGTPNLVTSKSLPVSYANGASRNGVLNNKSINNKIRPRFSLNNKLNNTNTSGSTTTSLNSNPNSNGSASSNDTSSAAYIQKLKTCIDANRRNINQRLNLNNNNNNSNSISNNKAINSSKSENSNSHLNQLPLSQGIGGTNNNNNQYQYHQNKQLIVIKPADDINDLDNNAKQNGYERNILKRQHTSIDSSYSAQGETKTDDDYESNKKMCIKLPVTIIDTIKAEPTIPLAQNENTNKQTVEQEKESNSCNDIQNSINETASNMQQIELDKNDLVKTDQNELTKIRPVSSLSPIIKVQGVLFEKLEAADLNNNNSDNNDLFKVNVDVYYCKLCCMVLNEEKNIKQHISTVTHKTKLSQNKGESNLNENIEPISADSDANASPSGQTRLRSKQQQN